MIPVKKNSSRLPGKNLKPFGNSTLLEHKIQQLKEVGRIDRIIVSSDSFEMLDKASRLGVEAIERPTNLADESRPLTEFFDYICGLLNDKAHLMWACCTSPLFGTGLMNSALDHYEAALKSGHDSLITVTNFQHYLLDEKGPLNYELPSDSAAHSNSQDLPKWHAFTNGILLAPIKSVSKWRYNYGPKAYRFMVDQDVAIDIDTVYDYEFAKAMYAKFSEKYN